ncbi:MAG: adenosine deaminase [Chloroflexota bacterium]|nr:adenosine deaminase [Chloroflexota bacterium]
MSIEDFIREMPKVVLHVHLEGSIRPGTFLKLAKRHGIELPADDPAGLRRWYQFTDFNHFIEVYLKIAQSLKTPEDIELIAREFFEGQAEQNVRYCEVIYSPYNQYEVNAIPVDEQLDALNRARARAKSEWGLESQFIFDISRETTPEQGITVAEWAIANHDRGVCALGLGGPEVGNPPVKFKDAFALAYESGLPAIPHAGETVGPESVWGALACLHPVRIEHGVRGMEDPDLVAKLRRLQMPLDVCPTSNICLKVYPSLEKHPLKQMLAAGLNITLNPDDPPLFNTTLTQEYLNAVQVMGLSLEELKGLVVNAIHAALLPEERKATLEMLFLSESDRLAEINL